MPKRTVIPFKREPEKSCWHTYSLQDLQPERFVRVVAGIIAGRMTLFPVIDAPELKVESAEA